MSTEFFNDQWRIPSNENQNKISNYSMEFDGSSDFIDSNSSPEALVGSNHAYTVSAWVNPSVSGNLKIVGAMDTGNRWYFRVLNGYASYSYGAATSGNDYQGTAAPIALNTWSHVVFTFDGSTTHKIYVNGILKLTESSGSAQTITNSKNAYIGALNLNGSTVNFFNGKIDQVTIFDYALSQDQVTQLGAEGYAFNFIPNDYIDLGTTTSYDTGDLSAAIWVNASSSRTGTVYAFSNSGSPSIAGFDFVIYTDNKVRIRRSITTKSNQTSQLSVGFTSDIWQHLALTYSESTNTLKVFLNGVLKATNIGTNQTTIASKKLTIGSYEGASAFFNGELSNAAIFSSKLEDSEIATIYNNGVPGDISSLNPVAWYKLNSADTFNGSNWTIKDYGSGSNDGTSVGMNSANLVQSNLDITTPYSNYSIKFNGSDQHFGDGTTSGIFNGATSFSISQWMTIDPGETTSIGASNWQGSGQYQYLIRYRVQSGGFDFYVRVNNVSGLARFTITSQAGVWYHIVGTWDGSNVRIYVNGVIGQTTARPGTLNASTGENLIGIYQSNRCSWNRYSFR